MLELEQIFANNPDFLPPIWISVRQSRPPWRAIVLHFIAKQEDVDKDAGIKMLIKMTIKMIMILVMIKVLEAMMFLVRIGKQDRQTTSQK